MIEEKQKGSFFLEFKNNTYKIHGEKYKVVSDYSEYKTLRSPLRCLCVLHGEYTVPKANTILVSKYAGCKECERSEEAANFINKANKLHGDKYTYFKDKYIDSRHYTEILCNKHNTVFKQRPSAHLQGQNCPLCGKESSIINSTKHNEDFIKQAIEMYGNTYDLSQVEYTGAFNKVKVICKQHGSFEIAPNNLLCGNGCALCNKEVRRLELEKDFPIKANKVHKGKYDYSLVNYKTNITPVEIHCLRHNKIFKMSPNKHLNGSGCPLCAKDSMGRWTISAIMKNVDIFDTKEGYCYLFRIEDSGVVYHKIGFTSLPSLASRLNMIIKESITSVCSIVSYKKTSLTNAIKLEKILHKVLDKNRLSKNNLTFGGKTEVFILNDQEVSNVIKLFENFEDDILTSYTTNKIPTDILEIVSCYFKS